MKSLVFGLAVLAMISACSAVCNRMHKSHPELRNDEFPSCNAGTTRCTIGCDAANGWVDISGNPPYSVRCKDDKWDFAGRDKPQYHLECVKPPSCDPLENPPNGKVDCSEKILESSCTYTCNKGYDVEQASDQAEYKVECIRDDPPNEENAKWSKDPATCKRIVCNPAPEAPINGRRTCNKGTKLGSVCRFWCDKNYDLRGTTKTEVTSKCVEDANPFDALGEWNQPLRECDPVTCKEIPQAPENGEATYPDDSTVGSQTVFACDAGYRLEGKKVSICKQDNDGDADGVWDPPYPPKCVIKSCRRPAVNKNVIEKCDSKVSGKYPVATTCTYTCRNPGTYMTPHNDKGVIKSGTMTSKCRPNTKWTRRPPHCYPVICEPPQKAPKNGYDPRCSRANKYRSSCTFNCLDKYELSHDRPVVCSDDGDGDKFGLWSEKAPTCNASVCDDFRQIANGYIDYSDRNYIGSVGTVHCNHQFTPKKNREITCLAPDGGRNKPYWNPSDLVCCVKCAINPRLRVAIAIDKTIAQNAADWREIYSFVDITVGRLFQKGGFQISIGVIVYNGIDQVLDMREIKVRGDLERIRSEMSSMFFGGTGVTFAGEAVRYASNNMFVGEYTDEPYLILMTGGKSGDNLETAVQEIKDRNINILAVGFETGPASRTGSLSRKELTDISGDPRNSFVIADWNNMKQITERMTRIAREVGCTKASANQSCPK